MDMDKLKKVELSTIDVCKEVGHFNCEAWLANDAQARSAFHARLGDGKALTYTAGLLQWEEVYGKETSFDGHYYMLSKVFVACDAPCGNLKNGMAILARKTEEDEPGMYLIQLYSGETLK